MQMEWTSITDELPVVWRDVLVATEDGFVGMAMRTESGNGTAGEGREWLFAGKYPIRYWMELPAVDGLDGVTKDKWKEAIR